MTHIDDWTYHRVYEVYMSISRREVLASLLGAGGTAVAGEITAAGQSNEPRVLSGSDIGFRIEGIAKDGAPIGAIVVRVDGKWVSPQFQSGMRRVS
jgi:hypothetical protein